jgi:adenine phosphoribosyltransferase
MTNIDIRNFIRDVENFPKEGILFKDITPILQNAAAFNDVLEKFSEMVVGTPINSIVGIEARGFIFGAALASKLEMPFVPIRKKGKLPYKTFSESYDLEYGTDTVEVHEDAFERNNKAILIDDLLATGGTAAAAIRLITKAGGEIQKIGFVVELEFLKGREKLKNFAVETLVKY